MGVNRGKQFEEKIREGFFKCENTTITRLIDPQAGYVGVRNICDFIVYHYPNQFMIECKSHYGNTLPFSCITPNQWNGLLEVSTVDGVKAGIMVWFIDHDKTYFVDIRYMEELKKQGKKSLNVKDLDIVYWALEIKGKKKRILFDYDMRELLTHCW